MSQRRYNLRSRSVTVRDIDPSDYFPQSTMATRKRKTSNVKSSPNTYKEQKREVPDDVGDLPGDGKLVPPLVKYLFGAETIGCTFRPLPMYEHIGEVVKPSKLTTISSTTLLNFRLNKEHTQLLSDKSLQILLRLSRYRKQKGKDWDLYPPLKDLLPSVMSVSVNNCAVKLPDFRRTKKGQQPQRFNLPIDITPYCTPTYKRVNVMLLDLRDPSNNYALFQYAFTVDIVKHLTVDEVIKQMKATSTISVADCKNFVKKKLTPDLNSSVCTTSLELSLICPLGKVRMKTPVRPYTCSHLQCFDAHTFLMMNEQRPSWICPVCNKPSEFEYLRVDEYFTEILEQCTSEEVQLLEDGSWKPHQVKEEVVDLLSQQQNKENIDLTIKVEDDAASEKSVQSMVVIDLTDD